MHDLGPKIRQALSSNEEDDDEAASRVSRLKCITTVLCCIIQL